jgi:hypothetical protein
MYDLSRTTKKVNESMLPDDTGLAICRRMLVTQVFALLCGALLCVPWIAVNAQSVGSLTYWGVLTVTLLAVITCCVMAPVIIMLNPLALFGAAPLAAIVGLCSFALANLSAVRIAVVSGECSVLTRMARQVTMLNSVNCCIYSVKHVDMLVDHLTFACASAHCPDNLLIDASLVLGAWCMCSMSFSYVFWAREQRSMIFNHTNSFKQFVFRTSLWKMQQQVLDEATNPPPQDDLALEMVSCPERL